MQSLRAPGQLLRLNQAIAQTGFCSRRKADELIAAGQVQVNGRVCRDFNAQIDETKDALRVNGKLLSFRKYAYVALHKPRGVVTTKADERGRKTVIDLLPSDLKHLKPVGRLDMYSEGLLILTNDGQLALELTHPRHHLPKRYVVTARGSVSDKTLQMLREGVELSDGLTLPAAVHVASRGQRSTKIEITIFEGRNRQLRRMFETVGHPVQRLVRVAIGGLQLGHMSPGTWRYLTSQEVSALKEQTTPT